MDNMVKYLKETITDKMPITDIINIFEEASQPMNDEDMILFETGTFNFIGEEQFYFSLVKQFSSGDDEYCQVHIDILYEPDSKNKKYHSAIWNDDIDENIFDYIRNSEALAYAKDNEYTQIEIYMDET
ncbi:MAG: hypothetical protein NC213_07860 [Acetobacter sp.]|nr:hypothetical protein [Bacteroides sp.]MCM1341645.1 hypothetical protein [Acetobacter sp.]MCM1434034.1 hypothetical protein [Clostridiales bacterium]